MSVTLVIAVTAAVAASMGYLAAKRHGGAKPGREDTDEKDDGDETATKKQKDEAPKQKAGSRKNEPEAGPGKADPATFASLPLALGDVVTSGTEERWLAGAVVARDQGRVIAALFIAPEGAEQKAVAVFAPPRKDAWWMSPTEIASPEEPPATVEFAGVALPRKARLPVKLARHGQGTPILGEEGIWAVYERGRDVAIVVSSEGRAHAWVGVRLDEEEYDRLGGAGED
jgi:hypothetical protein